MSDVNEIIIQLKQFGFKGVREELQALSTLIQQAGSVDPKKLQSFARELENTGVITSKTSARLTEIIDKFKLLRAETQKSGDLRKFSASLNIASSNEFVKQVRSGVQNTGEQLRNLNVSLTPKLDLQKAENKLNQEIAAVKDRIQLSFGKNVIDIGAPLRGAIGNFPDVEKSAVRLREVVTLLKASLKENLQNLTTEKDRANAVTQYAQNLHSIQHFLGVANARQPISSLPTTSSAGNLNVVIENEKKLADESLKASNEVIKQKEALKENEKAQQQLGATIGESVVRLIRYRVAFFALQGVLQGFRESFTTFIELQSQFADLQKVINPLTDSIEKYKEASFSLGQAVGASAQEVASSLKIFAQAGLSQQDVLKAAQSTLIGYLSTGLSAKDVTEALTAVFFTYGESVDNANTILSKFLAVERAFPVSAADLANSIKIVGSAATVVGVNIDDLLGFITAIGSATRKSGIAVAQALKTIFAELPNPASITALNQVGVTVARTLDDFRDFDNVLGDLAQKWDSLSSVQKANISVATAGVRRYSDFIALMNNYDLKLQAVAISQRATTEALTAANIQIGTVKNLFAAAGNALTELGFQLGDNLLKPITLLAKAFISLTQFIKPIAPFLSKVVATFLAFGAVAGAFLVTSKLLTFVLSKLFLTLSEGNVAIGVQTGLLARATILWEAYAASMGGADLAGTAFAGTMSLINASLGIFSLVAAAAAAIWVFFGKQTTLATEAVRTYEQVMTAALDSVNKKVTANSSAIEALGPSIEKIKSLDTQVTANIGIGDSSKSLQDLQLRLKNLKELFPDLSQEIEKYSSTIGQSKTGIDAFVDALTKKQEALSKEKQVLTDLQKIEKARTIDDVTSARDALNKKIELETQKISALIPQQEKLNNAIEDTKNTIRTFEPGSNSKIITGLIGTDADFNELKKREADIGDFQDAFDNFQKTLKQKVSQNAPSLIFNLEKQGFSKEEIQKAADQLHTFKGVDLSIPLGELQQAFNQQSVTSFAQLSDSTKSHLRLSFTKALKDGLNDVKNQLDFSSLFQSTILQPFEDQRDKLNAILADISKPPEPTEVILKIPDVADKDTRALVKKFTDIKTEMEKGKQAYKEYLETIKSGDNVDSVLSFNLDRDVKSLENLRDVAKEVAEKIKETNIQNEAFTKLINIGDIQKGDNSGAALNARTTALNAFLKEGSAAAKFAREFVQDTDDITKVSGKAADQLATNIENLKALNKESQDTSKAQKDLATSISIANDQLKKQQDNITFIDREGKKALFNKDVEIASLGKFESKQFDVLELERQRVLIANETALEIAKQNDQIHGTNEAAKVIEKNFENILAITLKIRQARIEKALEPFLKNATLLRDTLQRAFESIPQTILDTADKRFNATEAVKSAEVELADAKRQGDINAISAAQQRLKLAQQEMSQYVKGWSEVKSLVLDIFGSISSSFWQQISSRLAEQLSNITLGSSTLGDKAGDFITKGTQVNPKSREEVIVSANTQATIDNTDALTKATEEAKGSNEKTSEETSKSLGEVGQIIKAFGVLLAATAATAIVGTKNKGAQVGAGFGSALGSSIGTVLTKNSSFLLQAVGPILGAFGGGILGGLLGGLLGGSSRESQQNLPKVLEDNTRATIENTLALKQLDKALFNAPTRFNVPAFNGGTGSGRQVIIQIQGGNIEQGVQQVIRTLRDEFNADRVSFGTRGFVSI